MDATIAPVSQTEDLGYQLAAPAEWGPGRRTPCFAARMSGLYMSRDGGQVWRSAYETLNLSQGLPTLSVGVSPDFKREPAVFAGFNGGLLRSLDAGLTWENIVFPEPPPAIVAISISPNYRDDRLVFAASLEDGVFYSSDGGAHWRTGNLGLIDPNVFCLGLSPAFEALPTLYAGTQSGLFCSQNAGRSWREVELPFGYDAVISLALSPDFARDATLFAGTETQGLLCSEDAGQSWQHVGRPILANAINQIVLSPDFPREPQLLVLHDGGLYRSEDRGRTWRRWQPALLKHQTATAVLAPRGFGAGGPVLVGLEDGRAICLKG